MSNTTQTREFICEICGDNIYSFGFDTGENICGICKWLQIYIKDPEERKKITKLVRGEEDVETKENDK